MTIYTGGVRHSPVNILELQPVTTGEVVGAFAEDPTISPLEMIRRAGKRTIAQEGEFIPPEQVGDEFSGFMEEPEYIPPKTNIVPLEDQQQQIADAGVNIAPKEGMRQETLNILMQGKREENDRKSVTMRATTGQSALGFLAAVGYSATDPINFMSAFVPVVGPAKYAAMLERAGSGLAKASLRARVGALEGAVGAALVEPLVYNLAQNEQADYTLADSFLALAMGTTLGGGLHAGLGAVSDALIKGRTNVRPDNDNGRVVAGLSEMQRADIQRSAIAMALADASPNIGLMDPLVNLRPTGADIPFSIPGAARAISGMQATDPRIKVEVKLSEGIQASDVMAKVRKDNQELFDEFDRTASEVDDLVEQHGKLTAEIEAAEPLVQRIEDQKRQLKTADKRKSKRLERNIQKAEQQLKDLGFQGELPAIKSRITRTKKKMEKGELTRKDLESKEYNLQKKTEGLINKTLSRPTDPDSVGRRIESISVVENLRQYDADQVAQVDDFMANNPREKFDTLEGAEESLREQNESIKELAEELGIEVDIPVELLNEADDIANYEKAANAAAVCQLRLN